MRRLCCQRFVFSSRFRSLFVWCCSLRHELLSRRAMGVSRPRCQSSARCSHSFQAWFAIGWSIIFLRWAVRIRTIGLKNFCPDDYLQILVSWLLCGTGVLVLTVSVRSADSSPPIPFSCTPCVSRDADLVCNEHADHVRLYRSQCRPHACTDPKLDRSRCPPARERVKVPDGRLVHVHRVAVVHEVFHALLLVSRLVCRGRQPRLAS